MYYNKVDLCGINTARLPVLKEAEKTQLLKTIRAGGTEAAGAREAMISGNLRLVLSVVQRFAGRYGGRSRSENMDDLFQVGCIGLIKAIDNFDITQGVRFSTYGVPMIVGEIRRFLRDDSPIRVSRSVRDLAYRAMQAREELQKARGSEPSAADIAAHIGAEESAVTLALESVVDPISLYEPVYNDGGDTVYVMDQIGDKNDEDSWISTILFRDSFAGMNPREKTILSRRFLQGKTQVDVAKEIGISQAQVSRLEKNALKKVKQQIS
ncbi:MAG: SigB/SigF/SigG family RNA polymerase sigma factor [Oscillospiraceae bacterium]|nr:SigB/SigF/SigG family RNA polymerase sigma factor [Oscillospiraceae bacterium]